VSKWKVNTLQMVAIMLETDDLNFSAIQKYASGLLSLMMDKFSSALHSK
jgi:hypothetical protein